MPRTLIVGDVHGCRDELESLLEKAAITASDRVVFVGDLIVRGPDPKGVLDLVQKLGARVVRGNHEDRLLASRKDPKYPLGDAQKATIAEMRKRHWAMIEGWPLWLDLPEHGVRVVHAGVVPGLPIEKQDPHAIMYMRSLGPGNEPHEKRGEVLWGARYTGPPHVVFGHNARAEVQIHPWATGLDTGAVYGGRLTGMLLETGERPPPVGERLGCLISVPARRRYFDP